MENTDISPVQKKKRLIISKVVDQLAFLLYFDQFTYQRFTVKMPLKNPGKKTQFLAFISSNA